MTITTGATVQVANAHGSEPARVLRWLKANGPRIPGYHKVQFNDGAVLLVHQGRFVGAA